MIILRTQNRMELLPEQLQLQTTKNQTTQALM